MSFSRYYWLVPFLSFILGYELLNTMIAIPEYEVPALIGLSLAEVARVSSDNNFIIRIIGYREEHDLEENTILEQSPTAHHTIKQHQPIFLTLSKKPAKKAAPDFKTKQQHIIDDYCKRNNIRPKYYFLPSVYPQHTCIGQSPESGTFLDAHTMDIYLSDSSSTLCVFPDLKHIPLFEVKEFFEKYQAKITVMHYREPQALHDCHTCMVIEQKPLPGSLVDLTKPLSVQLQVDY